MMAINIQSNAKRISSFLRTYRTAAPLRFIQSGKLYTREIKHKCGGPKPLKYKKIDIKGNNVHFRNGIREAGGVHSDIKSHIRDGYAETE